MITRTTSSLPPELDELIERVIGCLIDVHRQLGPGFLERAYHQATCVELSARSIPFEEERAVDVIYRGQRILGQRLDLLVDGCLVLELKAVARLEPIPVSQLVSYLTASGLRAGLLVNFNVPQLRNGIRRVVR